MSSCSAFFCYFFKVGVKMKMRTLKDLALVKKMTPLKYLNAK